MFTSFSTALSALSAQSTAIDVVGNNLANMNTSGYKASVVSFHDLVTQNLGAGLGETQVGFGVGRPVTLRQFSQGATQTTNGPLDVAIQGDGFLLAKDEGQNVVYTRGGNLQVDKVGNLLTSTGQRLQGWTSANGVLNTNSAPGDIQVPVGSVKPPIPSTTFHLDLNLDAAGTAGPPPTTFANSLKMVDSLGGSHLVTVTFTKSATANSWDYAVSASDGTVGGAGATGTLTFGADGRLTSPTVTDVAPQIDLTALPNGANDLSVSWSLFNGAEPRLTQFAQPSSLSGQFQNGAPAAQLVQVALGDGGTVLARYSDSTQTVVGQLAMAGIRNPESMIAVGNNNFQLSARTGSPAVGVPGTGGRGSILGGSVESSNVDMAKEFTNLIVYQRGYQANAKIITTVDELSQETINLKR